MIKKHWLKLNRLLTYLILLILTSAFVAGCGEDTSEENRNKYYTENTLSFFDPLR